MWFRPEGGRREPPVDLRHSARRNDGSGDAHCAADEDDASELLDT